jgi:hypothetical protein
VEVFRLRVGCPPEHLYEHLRVVVDPELIERVVDECAHLRAVLPEGTTPLEGSAILEFRFYLSDGACSVVRRFESD